MRGSPVIMAAMGGLHLDSAAINAAINSFQSAASHNGQRGDAAGERLRNFRMDRNGRSITAAFRNAGREDAFSSTAGFHMARDLEFIHAEVLEEEFPMPNALRLFPLTDSIPVGARTHTMRRVYKHGEARVYRGPGDEVPRVGATQREESWPVRHIVSGYAFDIFEAQSAEFAGSAILSKDLPRGARDTIMELANRIWWQGAPEHGLYGVLTYPWLAKKDMSGGWDRASVEADPHGTLGQLHALVNYPHQRSKSVFQPTKLAMPTQIHDVLSSVALASGSDTTIMEHFLKNSNHIKSVEIAWELEDAGGSGVHGVLAYRDDQQGIQIGMPQGVTQLPIQTKGLESEVINYASISSVIMPNAGNNALGYADTNT